MEKTLNELKQLKKLVNKYGVTLQEIRAYVGERLTRLSQQHLKEVGQKGTNADTN